MNPIDVLLEKISTNQNLSNEEILILADFMFSNNLTQDKFYLDFNILNHKISKKGVK